MEYVNSVWQIGIIALVAGAMIGALAYRLFAPSRKQADKIKTELDVTREELDRYKASVNQHFNKTSELVNDLTQNYVKVYQHLAEGAQTLGDSRTFTNLLEQHQGRVSIAVDDATNVTGKVAGNVFADPAATPATPVETLHEPAEPSIDLKADGADPMGMETDPGKTGIASASGKLDDSIEASEPVLNIDAIEEVTENADTESPAETGSAIRDKKEKAGVKPSVH